jgi:hypothetical protein
MLNPVWTSEDDCEDAVEELEEEFFQCGFMGAGRAKKESGGYEYRIRCGDKENRFDSLGELVDFESFQVKFAECTGLWIKGDRKEVHGKWDYVVSRLLMTVEEEVDEIQGTKGGRNE